MVQAAVEGIVDFSKADVYDPRWHRYLQLILGGLERRNRRAMKKMAYEQTLTVYASRKLKAESLEEITQRITDLYYSIRETYYPTEKGKHVQLEQQAVKQDIRGWEARFGDLSSAESKAKLDAFAKAMDQLRQETAAKQSRAAASQLGYAGQQLGMSPAAMAGQRRPGKGS